MSRSVFGRLFFGTGDSGADKRLSQLAAMSNPEVDYTEASQLQNWLEGIIGYITKLPDSMQNKIILAEFQIGDAHYRWTAAQIKTWHKARCRMLREQLSKLSKAS
jgi:hypothetical protein